MHPRTHLPSRDLASERFDAASGATGARAIQMVRESSGVVARVDHGRSMLAGSAATPQRCRGTNGISLKRAPRTLPRSAPWE